MIGLNICVLISSTSMGNPFTKPFLVCAWMGLAGRETKMYLITWLVSQIVPNVDQVSLSVHYSIVSSHQIIPINTAVEDNPSCQGFSRYELFLLDGSNLHKAKQFGLVCLYKVSIQIIFRWSCGGDPVHTAHKCTVIPSKYEIYMKIQVFEF